MLEIENSNSKNVLHNSASIHLIPIGTDLIVSPSGLGILSPAQNDQQKLKNLRTQIYMDLSYIIVDPQARVLNYCYK